jgi:N-methylhydantoinase B/oxoprolinase/acetone carboxylase alpha subunit
MKSKMGFRRLCIFPFYLFFTFIVGCSSNEMQYVGTYEVIKGGSGAETGSRLVLKEKGEGIWETEDDEVSISWYRKGDELRFHTKNGGVIVGAIHKDTISVTLPGNRSFMFRKK